LLGSIKQKANISISQFSHKNKALPDRFRRALAEARGKSFRGTVRVLDYDDFANIRFGSEADERGCPGDFRCATDSGCRVSAL